MAIKSPSGQHLCQLLIPKPAPTLRSAQLLLLLRVEVAAACCCRCCCCCYLLAFAWASLLTISAEASCNFVPVLRFFLLDAITLNNFLLLIFRSTRLTLSCAVLCLGFCLWFCLIYVTRVLIKRPKGMHCEKVWLPPHPLRNNK